MGNVETVQFRGCTFRRYPDATTWAERAYFTPGIADRQAGRRRLHEEVWIAHHGPIPAGHHVHHRDGDTLNSGIGNLELLTEAEHREHHAALWEGRELTPAHAAQLDRIRPLAAVWHGTAEGRAWHAEHGRRAWAGREERDRVCERCGTGYRTKSSTGRERFCSAACKAAARRASGTDLETRECGCCAGEFRVDRYSRTRFCSRSCSVRHAARKSCGCHVA